MPKSDATHTRDRALEAAEAMLHAHGHRGLSMDAVARAVGIRKASLYHHFPDGKDHLELEIAERLIERDGARFREALERGRDVRGRLEAMAAFVFEDRRQTDRVLRDSLRFMPDAHRARLSHGFMEGMYARVLEVFREGVRSGELRAHDAELSAWAFMGLLSEMNQPEMHDRYPDLAARVAEMLVEGLRPAAPNPPAAHRAPPEERP